MPCFTASLRRALAATLSAISVIAAVMISSLPAGAGVLAPDGNAGPTRPAPQVLVAPFACGTLIDGSTYPGHGRNNWNLDVGRAGLPTSADHGLPLFAQGDGTVVWAEQTGYNNRAGTYLEIDYGEITARYLHLVESSIPVEVAVVGARVRSGDLIGLLGDTGRASGPHLHLEYWDSHDVTGARAYELPGDRHVPVTFGGVPQIATPRTPTDPVMSTNCTGDAARSTERHRLERLSASDGTAPVLTD